jgi:hypothetical protein
MQIAIEQEPNGDIVCWVKDERILLISEADKANSESLKKRIMEQVRHKFGDVPVRWVS